ncbi:lipopolysaccharide assembly protein LapA domain-containing protein [Streptosporangium sp. NPDC001559]|uniref:lipopolysaccharide assembly protein LapA domain-containing protein n=1 Tax=Streptosporangium sp. NPDC001559 TaxID=3366187 RepID=UPI0036EFF2F5
MASAPGDGSWSFGKWISELPRRAWVALALLVLGVSFIAQNRVPVRVRWLVFGVTWPLWLALLVMLVVGVLIGVLVRRRSARRR